MQGVPGIGSCTLKGSNAPAVAPVGSIIAERGPVTKVRVVNTGVGVSNVAATQGFV